jgi:glucosamine-phosphate N-acetyltransferase
MATRLFPSNLISVEIYDLLPPGYIIRPLERGDHGRGFFDCLKSLTWTGEIDERQFQERFDWMRDKSPGWFYDVVIEYEEEIVATGVLIVERKLYVLCYTFPLCVTSTNRMRSAYGIWAWSVI